MWTPKTEEELVTAVTNGDVSEGPAFDAKREVSEKNLDIAKDIAAMANDGGVIIYGIGEDGNGEPTIPNPVSLRGLDEKITAIVRTRLDKPPYIRPYPIPTGVDPSVGYFVVVVPQSENAPHMVLGDKENRYYGRSGKSNILLTESEVARLYERRRRWEVDQEALLDKVIADAPSPVPELSYLHLFAKPLLDNEDRLSLAARGKANEVVALNKLLERAAEPQVYPEPVSPSFRAAYRVRHTDDGYSLVLSGNDTAPPDRRNDDLLTLTVTRGLATTLFYAGLATELSRFGKTILAVHLADYTTRCFRFVGDLLAKAGYLGAVDCGIAVTNIRGISLAYREQYYMPSMGAVGYPKDVYRRTARRTVSLLQEEPHEAARALVMPLVSAMSQGKVDLFSMFGKKEPQP